MVSVLNIIKNKFKVRIETIYQLNEALENKDLSSVEFDNKETWLTKNPLEEQNDFKNITHPSQLDNLENDNYHISSDLVFIILKEKLKEIEQLKQIIKSKDFDLNCKTAYGER
ncbi:hypothetical protein RB653_000965 [Dictyostelium firmibasis]|uniref:Uncharacterized protein n=1 Tax=Dictyostelium firmibasis TaxID=79012 RepID=A0AAN7UG13_9MYCE